MDNLNELLDRIEAAGLWAYFHKDWLLEIRTALRPQLPDDYHVFVESETIVISPDSETASTPLLPDLSIARPEQVRSGPTSRPSPDASAAVIEYSEPIEVESKYSLLIRRAPENRIVAALEIISPTNKGSSSRFDREKFISKREEYLAARVNYLEIDALRNGVRLLPARLAKLADFERHAWTAFHHLGQRRFRGCGWNHEDPLPLVPWSIDETINMTIDFAATVKSASEFNRWSQLVK